MPRISSAYSETIQITSAAATTHSDLIVISFNFWFGTEARFDTNRVIHFTVCGELFRHDALVKFNKQKRKYMHSLLSYCFEQNLNRILYINMVRGKMIYIYIYVYQYYLCIKKYKIYIICKYNFRPSVIADIAADIQLPRLHVAHNNNMDIIVLLN